MRNCSEALCPLLIDVHTREKNDVAGQWKEILALKQVVKLRQSRE